MNQNHVAVVVGTGISTMLGVIQSLGEMNVVVDAYVASGNKVDLNILKRSKYIRKFLSSRKSSEEIMIKTLMDAYQNEAVKPVLFATGDYFAALMDRHYEELQTKFLLPYACREGVPTEGQINFLMDKSLQNEMARRCGINVSSEWVVDLRTLPFAIEAVAYPCIVKPIMSIRGSKSEIKKCLNREELVAYLETLKQQNADREVLVQEFHDIADEYILTGLCFGDRIIAPVMSRRLMVAQYKRGLTITGEIMDLSALGEDREKYMELLRSFHYIGMFGMDVFVCKNGRIVFNEMNYRATGVIRGLTKAGFNVPYLLYQYLTLQTEDFQYDVKYGSIFFHDKIAWDEYIHHTISRADMKRLNKLCDFHTLKDEKDNGPYRYTMITSYLKFIKHQLFR